ncbi:MAG: hypothetical protein P4L22_00300 [Candidatus Babeliales bacterium]|nr:hypothetical protein [Candidatus Babeliales bacterium]
MTSLYISKPTKKMFAVLLIISIISLCVAIWNYSSNEKILIKEFIIPFYVSVFSLFFVNFFIWTGFLIVLFKRYYNNHPYIDITNEGIKFQHTKLIKWNDIKSINIAKPNKTEYIEIYLNDPIDFNSDQKILTQINMIITVYFKFPHYAIGDNLLFNNYKITAQEIMAIINNYKK